MSQGAPAGASDTRLLTTPWVHRNAGGLEIGVERPTGLPSSARVAFRSALLLTWELRQALWVLVLKDFKARYRAQALGLFWSLAHPLVMMATVTVAFTYVMGVRVPHFAVFYLIGSVFWQFVTNATLAAAGSLVENGGLVKQTTFPRFLFPVAAVLSHLIHLGMELVVVFAFYFFYPDAYHFNGTLAALPLLVLVTLVVLIGAGLLTSGLYVVFRDTHYLLTSFFTVAFWATPILYPLSMVPPSLQPLVRLNPMTGVIEGARSILMRGEWPHLADLLPAALVAVVLFVTGCAVFRRQNLKVADYA
jgi:lipopolysaccharide transport system permease protein